MGAALAFYTVFSLAPLAILVLSLVSLAVERNAARAEIVDKVRSFVGTQGAGLMKMILTQTAPLNTSVVGTVLGSVMLLIGASGVFGGLQDSLNEIWDVASKRSPLFVLVKERFLSFVMVFITSLLMLVWVYYSAQILSFGAVFTRLYALRYGSHRSGEVTLAQLDGQTGSLPK